MNILPEQQNDWAHFENSDYDERADAEFTGPGDDDAGVPTALICATDVDERELLRVWFKVQGYDCQATGDVARARRMLSKDRHTCLVAEVGPHCTGGYRLALLGVSFPDLVPCVCISDSLPRDEDPPQPAMRRASFIVRPLVYREFSKSLALAQERMEFERMYNARTVAREDKV
jgi:hypothetical protein